MAFLSPWFLAAGAVGVAALIAAHFIVVRQRTATALPTIRFVPRDTELAPTLHRAPADRVVLALRALAVALAAVALARPVLVPSSTTVTRIVVADLGGAADTAALLARAREVAGESGVVVETGGDDAAGSMSAGLAAAIREASRRGARGERVRLSVVSPFTSAAFDEATDSIRAAWPGRVESVPVRAAAAPARVAGSLTTRGPADDAVLAGFSLLPRSSLGGTVRVVRDSLLPPDSVVAAAGGVVVVWPVTRAGDTVAAVTAGDAVVLAEFTRPPSARARHGVVVARWVDGAPAAYERRIGSGCARFVSIGVPEAGDVAIGRPFVRFLRALVGPCGSPTDSGEASAAQRARLAGAGPAEIRLAAAGATQASSLVRWLLAGALALLVVELVVRARVRRRA